MFRMPAGTPFFPTDVFTYRFQSFNCSFVPMDNFTIVYCPSFDSSVLLTFIFDVCNKTTKKRTNSIRIAGGITRNGSKIVPFRAIGIFTVKGVKLRIAEAIRSHFRHGVNPQQVNKVNQNHSPIIQISNSA